jgi:outer membrane receptor protein involved in Fe transport
MNLMSWSGYLLLALATAAAHAEEIEEIVVTGEFRPTEVDRLPESVSVIGDGAIEARSAQHLEEIAALVPNLNLASGASRARYFQIRGIGERGQFVEPLNSSVGLIIDGVDFSGIGTIGTLFDVRQVEVFRGPQGTLFGANALAGLINVATFDPTDTLTSRVRLEAGDYGTYAFGGVLSGPLGSSTGYRLAAQQLRSDGYLDNDFLGRDDTNQHDELTLRGKLRIDFGGDTTLDLSSGYVDIDNGYDAFSLDNDREVLSDQPGHDKQRSTFGSARLTLAGNDRVRVETTVAAAYSDSEYGYDEDWTYVGFHPDGYSSTDDYLRDRHTATAEVRLLSNPAGRLFGGTTDWVLGAYGLTQREELTRRYTFLPSDFDSDFEVDRAALFGQLETALGAATTLTAGVRFERHSSEYDDSESVHFRPDDNLWGARLSLDRMLSERTLVYAAIARGYKAGGFNTDGTLPADLREYDPEVLYNYEIGAKGSYFDDRLTGRVSLFYMQRDDVQIASSLTRVRVDGSTEFIEYTGNAAEGINYGLELETEYRPIPALSLFGSLGLLETEYRDFVNSRGVDLDGREQAHAPAYQFAAGAELRSAGGWFGRIETEGKDEYFFSDSEDFKSDPYALLHLSAGLVRNAWSVRVWMRNVTDKDYAVRGYFFGNDPRIGYAERGYTQLGEPRHFGITLEVTP